ncbi:1-deoxy-D-xylulose-5-phosphate synthase [Streptomyces alboniger]
MSIDKTSATTQGDVAVDNPDAAAAAVTAVDPRLLVREQGLTGYLGEFKRKMKTGELGSIPVVIGLIVICVVFQSLNSNFLSAQNLSDITVTMVGTGMISVGIVFVLLLGEIDLSVGSVSGAASAIAAVLAVNQEAMAWEALNNIADAKDRPLVIVVNDNERSYAPTIGGLANHLATLRTTDGYERFLARGKDLLERTPVVGRPLYETLHGAKKGLKDFIAPQGMFEDLGLKYVGPIDGHDIEALESALARAKRFGGPVIVHCLTEKGRGYQPALQDEADRFHGIGPIHPDTGLPIKVSGADWTSVFGDEMVRLGKEREDIVAITAAMLQPVGLKKFADAFPDRIYDVGIAEQHAAVSAAGLAKGGVHPVFAVYATFLNRAFDQVLMDVALHKCGVTFVLDRAGVTGTDGASHNGMWDMSILQVVPGLRLSAPRDADQVRAQLREAVAVDDAPTVVRFSKGAVGPAVPAVGRVGGMDVLREPGTDTPDVLLVSVGALAPMCLEIANLLDKQGISTTVVDPRWVKPVDEAMAPLAERHRVVVTVEDNSRVGGVGSTIAQALRDAGVDVPLRDFGIPPRFLDHASRAEVMTEIGLTAPDIARQVTGLVSKLDGIPHSRLRSSGGTPVGSTAAEAESVEPARD